MVTDAITIRALRDAKLLSPEAITSATDAARTLRRPLASVCIERKLVAEPDLYRAISAALGVLFVDLRAHVIDRETLERIPASIALHRKVVAYAATPTSIRVAMEDPDDVVTIELLRRATNRDILPALAAPGALADALRMYRGDIESAVEELVQLSVQPEGKPTEERTGKELHALAEDVPVIRIVDTLLQHAISLRASDIHIEPTEQGVAVRYRIDGILRPEMTLPQSTAAGIVARIKILANLKLDEHRLPQDGRFKVTTPTERLAIRVAIMPVYDGEKVVLRLLREEGRALSLLDLGLRSAPLGDTAPLAVIERNMRKPHGIIFVTGPTGSGKTTTLYAMMNVLSTPAVNIATIEDPIEYRMPGVNQSQVNPRIGFTFAIGLRELLRQDPNIIMVGEIRDAETADIAVNAALTGHLVLATLHTNDAATSLTRLQEMDVPTFLVATTINAIIAQRLVRRLCPSCRTERTLERELVAQLEAHGEDLDRALACVAHLGDTKGHARKSAHATLASLRTWKPKGCAECRDEGYRGRIGIYEVLEVTTAIAELIQTRATSAALQAHAVTDGMATMFVDGIIKAAEGVTSVEEVLRVTRE